MAESLSGDLEFNRCLLTRDANRGHPTGLLHIGDGRLRPHRHEEAIPLIEYEA